MVMASESVSLEGCFKASFNNDVAHFRNLMDYNTPRASCSNCPYYSGYNSADILIRHSDYVYFVT